MEAKKPFKQVTIKQIQEKRESSDLMKKYTDNLLFEVDLATDRAVVDVLHELGYTEAVEGMTLEQAEEIHKKLNADGFFLNISRDVNSEGKLVIKISVVQVARELTFELDPTQLNKEG